MSLTPYSNRIRLLICKSPMPTETDELRVLIANKIESFLQRPRNAFDKFSDGCTKDVSLGELHYMVCGNLLDQFVLCRDVMDHVESANIYSSYPNPFRFSSVVSDLNNLKIPYIVFCLKNKDKLILDISSFIFSRSELFLGTPSELFDTIKNLLQEVINGQETLLNNSNSFKEICGTSYDFVNNFINLSNFINGHPEEREEHTSVLKKSLDLAANDLFNNFYGVNMNPRSLFYNQKVPPSKIFL